MGRRCFYINCNSCDNVGSQITFFKLPCDGRRDMWVLHCGSLAFIRNTENIKHVFICQKHFRSEDINYKGTKATLNINAIPLPYDSSFCRCDDYNIDTLCRTNVSKSKEVRKRSYASTSQDFSCTLPDVTGSYSPSSPELVVCRSDNVRTYIRDYKIPLIPERTTPSPTQFLEPPQKKSPSPSVFSKPFRTEEPPTTSSYNNSIENEYILELLESKTKDVKAFLNAQLFHKVGPGREWNSDEKNVFLKIYYKSPACYKAMQSMGFSMPHITTIMRWQSEVIFSPGINQTLINLLKYKCEKWNVLEKKCILLFDEMAIKNELEYDSRQDIIYGFTDFGNGDRKDTVASSALLFMVRGLNLNWKQSISYYVGAVDAENLKNIIVKTLEVLHSVGLDVVGITCDQSPINRKAYAKLGCTTERPYIKFENKKIVLLHDAVHLTKSIRNCLLKADIECKDKRISWKIVEKLFQEEKDDTIKTCFKLTEKHIHPDSFDKMNVKFATQVLSRQVSIGIQLGIHLNIFPPDKITTAAYTAESFQKLNDLFDCFNSVTRFSANPYRCALSDDKNHEDVMETLKECRTWISEWKHLGRMKRPYCFDGMIQTINGLFLIWQCVKTTQDYIITSHLNQDPLENSISILRRCKGSYERNPSALRLSRNLRQIAFQNLTPSVSTNYNISTGETLLSESSALSLPEENTIEILEDPQSEDIDNFVEEICLNKNYGDEVEEGIMTDKNILISTEQISDDEEKISKDEEISKSSTLESNAVVYFAGYVVNKMVNSYNCSTCKAVLLRSNEEETIHDYLLKLKAYKVTTDSIQGVPF